MLLAVLTFSGRKAWFASKATESLPCTSRKRGLTISSTSLVLLNHPCSDKRGVAVSKVYTVKLDMAQCNCTGHKLGGKLCTHIQAARYLRQSGPASEWTRK